MRRADDPIFPFDNADRSNSLGAIGLGLLLTDEPIVCAAAERRVRLGTTIDVEVYANGVTQAYEMFSLAEFTNLAHIAPTQPGAVEHQGTRWEWNASGVSVRVQDKPPFSLDWTSWARLVAVATQLQEEAV